MEEAHWLVPAQAGPILVQRDDAVEQVVVCHTSGVPYSPYMEPLWGLPGMLPLRGVTLVYPAIIPCVPGVP